MTGPTIWTSSWYAPLPDTHARIGISRGVPRRQPAGYRLCRQLSPGTWFNSVSPAEYRARYFGEVLARLNPQTTVDELQKLAGDRIPTLLCYEKPTDNQWCHRGMVSVWLKETLGLDVYEYGLEHEGCGWSHPKLPGEFRQDR